jgi:hypothetical protein
MAPHNTIQRTPSPFHDSADLRSLHHQHSTLGYRDGITTSKAAFVQAGFDEGYPLGGRIGLRVGRLLGVLHGLAATFPTDTEISRTLKSAEVELAAEKVFSAEWWDGDGVWKWVVDGEEEGGLDRVVEAFPLLTKWQTRVWALAEGRGLKTEELEG